MSEPALPPPGFEELPAGLGFTDVLRPVYRSVSEDQLALGMFVQAQHCNLINICHGGALMTLADIAAAQGVNHARDKIGGSPTLNLSFDFIAPAREGDWLVAVTERVELRRLFGFASGVIRREDTVVCRYSGSFYMPDHGGYDAHLSRIERLHGQG